MVFVVYGSNDNWFRVWERWIGYIAILIADRFQSSETYLQKANFLSLSGKESVIMIPSDYNHKIPYSSLVPWRSLTSEEMFLV